MTTIKDYEIEPDVGSGINPFRTDSNDTQAGTYTLYVTPTGKQRDRSGKLYPNQLALCPEGFEVRLCRQVNAVMLMRFYTSGKCVRQTGEKDAGMCECMPCAVPYTHEPHYLTSRRGHQQPTTHAKNTQTPTASPPTPGQTRRRARRTPACGATRPRPWWRRTTSSAGSGSPAATSVRCVYMCAVGGKLFAIQAQVAPLVYTDAGEGGGEGACLPCTVEITRTHPSTPTQLHRDPHPHPQQPRAHKHTTKSTPAARPTAITAMVMDHFSKLIPPFALPFRHNMNDNFVMYLGEDTAKAGVYPNLGKLIECIGSYVIPPPEHATTSHPYYSDAAYLLAVGYDVGLPAGTHYIAKVTATLPLTARNLVADPKIANNLEYDVRYASFSTLGLVEGGPTADTLDDATFHRFYGDRPGWAEDRKV